MRSGWCRPTETREPSRLTILAEGLLWTRNERPAPVQGSAKLGPRERCRKAAVVNPGSWPSPRRFRLGEGSGILKCGQVLELCNRVRGRSRCLRRGRRGCLGCTRRLPASNAPADDAGGTCNDSGSSDGAGNGSATKHDISFVVVGQVAARRSASATWTRGSCGIRPLRAAHRLHRDRARSLTTAVCKPPQGGADPGSGRYATRGRERAAHEVFVDASGNAHNSLSNAAGGGGSSMSSISNPERPMLRVHTD